MLRAGTITLPLLLVALGSAAPAPGAQSAPLFANPVELPASTNFAEPSLAAAADGTLYAAAPGACTQVWRSDDNGVSWQRVSCSQGQSGDSDVAVDSNGIVYASDLFNDAPVSASNNKASSFQFHTATADTNNLDRQWIATAGTTLFATWRDGNLHERFDRSTDGGHSFSAPITVVGNADKRGNVYAASPTDVYIPYTDADTEDLHIAISHDAGAHWATHDAAQTDGGNPCIFPTVARDQAGTLYIVYCDVGVYDGLLASSRIFLVVSHDDGVTWDAPIQLSDNNDDNVFPWMLADAAGHIEVAWYEGQLPGGLPFSSDPNSAALEQWFVKVVTSTDADSATPTFSGARVTPQVHTGPICTGGTGCLPGANPVYGNRAFLDFFEMAELPSGAGVIVFCEDASTLGLSGGTNLFTVVQTGGDFLK
jgi:hypothetical protein